MKVKQLLLGGVLFAAFSVNSLHSAAEVQIGVRAGVNFSNVAGKDEDGNKIQDNSLLPGFSCGRNF